MTGKNTRNSWAYRGVRYTWVMTDPQTGEAMLERTAEETDPAFDDMVDEYRRLQGRPTVAEDLARFGR